MPHGTTRKKNASGSGAIRKKTVQRGGKAYTYWEARYTVGFDPGTGKPRQRSITGKTQKEVREKLRQVTAELDLGIYQEPSKLTVDEWLVSGPESTWAEQIPGQRPEYPWSVS